ncbi:PREDICTED: uncharacterized protein LOC104609611 [Nelumbo nucifera]|uniref:Uncharacterized protein LOC104609611 n=1 Tax=Nelumbo nucifera TaxID=4432 RepID=A0A1U8B0Q3_NELNU|nr:PREDICTED: uncharacterized protein LOC104609611 [Nelumbo nucifera]
MALSDVIPLWGLGNESNAKNRDEKALVLAQVVGCKTSREVWDRLHVLFSSTSKTRIHDLKLELAYLKKGILTITNYVQKIKSLYDALAASGHFLIDVDQIHYLLGGLLAEYDTFVLSMTIRLDSLSFVEIQSLLLTFEKRLERHSSQSVLDFPSANLSNKKKTFNHNQSSSYKPRQFNNDGSSDNSKKISYNNNNHSKSNSKNVIVVCQLCGYPSHTAATCRRYLELTTNKPTKQAHTTSSSRSTHDENRYPDSGATNHMTSDLGNLSLHDEYHGTDHILIGNGTGLDISHIGSSILNNDSGSIVLKNILKEFLIYLRTYSLSASFVRIIMQLLFLTLLASLLRTKRLGKLSSKGRLREGSIN